MKNNIVCAAKTENELSPVYSEISDYENISN